MIIFNILLLSVFSYGDSVFVSPGYISIENTIFSLVEESESDSESETPVFSFGRRESVTDHLQYNSFSNEFSPSTSLEVSLLERWQKGENFYVIQSDLEASFSEPGAQVAGAEPVGSVDYTFRLEQGDKHVSYEYMGYIKHVDQQSTELGFEYSVVRSREFELCSLDDRASLKVDLIQEDLQVRGIYDSKVYCMFSENIEHNNEVFFVVSSESEDLFEEVKVSSETIVQLSEALSLRHRAVYDDTLEAQVELSLDDFEAPQVFFGSGPRIGNVNLERFNEQRGINNEVHLEYDVSNEGCKRESSLMLALFEPLEQEEEYKLWEVSLKSTCESEEDVTQTFELNFGNAFSVGESSSFDFGGGFDGDFVFEVDVESSFSEPVNSLQLSYAYDSEKLDYKLNFIIAEVEDLWIYELNFDRSLELESKDRYDLKFSFVSTDESQFLYTGFGYYYHDYQTQIEAGLTSDFDANLYLSMGLRAEDPSNGLNYSWQVGFPFSDVEVLNQGPGLQSSEKFFQLNVGSNTCEPTESLCWRGSVQRVGGVNGLGFGGLIEF